jgi:uncharacterized protein YutE (UPF0331/DUF86 family)
VSPVDTTLLRSKASSMGEHLDLLSRKVGTPVDDYESNRDLQLQVERLSQLAVECAVDMASIVLEGAGQAPSPSARDAFLRLPGVLPAARAIAGRFAWRYTGFRNRLVHEYDRLDQRIVLTTARELVADGRRFLRAVGPLLRPVPARRRRRRRP